MCEFRGPNEVFFSSVSEIIMFTGTHDGIYAHRTTYTERSGLFFTNPNIQLQFRTDDKFIHAVLLHFRVRRLQRMRLEIVYTHTEHTCGPCGSFRTCLCFGWRVCGEPHSINISYTIDYSTDFGSISFASWSKGTNTQKLHAAAGRRIGEMFNEAIKRRTMHPSHSQQSRT